MENTIEFLKEIVKKLESNSIYTIVFGGWARELNNLCEPRNHKDIDLLWVSDDFSLVDDFIFNFKIKEITEKRFSHKRAFIYKGIVVEIFLIRSENGHYSSIFFETLTLQWPSTLFKEMNGFRVAMPEVIDWYEDQHSKIEAFRI